MLVSVIDTETCSLEGGVLEIAAVVVEPTTRRIVGWAESLVKPDRPVTPEARAVHHVTDAELDGRPSIDDVMSTLGPYLEPNGIMLAAHNASFDSGVLPPRWRPVNKLLPGPADGRAGEGIWVDTLRCAKHLLPDAPRYGNQVLRYWLEEAGESVTEFGEPPIPDSAGKTPHRALYDAWVTAGLLRWMLRSCTVDELVRLSGDPVMLTKVTFGKYAGRTWDEVVRIDRRYVKWVADNVDDPDAAHTARRWLEG